MSEELNKLTKEWKLKTEELLEKDGDKWRCDACGRLDWMIIHLKIGKFFSKFCYNCYLEIKDSGEVIRAQEGRDEKTINLL